MLLSHLLSDPQLVNMKLRTRVATEMHRLITSSERHEFVSERLHDLHAMMEFMGVEGREELLIETATPKASESAAFGHQSLGDSAQLHSWGRMRALKTDVKVNARTAIQELALTELHQTIKGTTFYRCVCSSIAARVLCTALQPAYSLGHVLFFCDALSYLQAMAINTTAGCSARVKFQTSGQQTKLIRCTLRGSVRIKNISGSVEMVHGSFLLRKIGSVHFAS